MPAYAAATQRRRTRLSVLLLLAVSALPGLAKSAEPPPSCEKEATTQTAMNMCASKEAERVDAERTKVYQKLLSKGAKTPLAAGKIEGAERAWLAYRDALLEAAFPAKDKQAESGTMYPMEADALRTRLTQQHIKELEDLLGRY